MRVDNTLYSVHQAGCPPAMNLLCVNLCSSRVEHLSLDY